MGSNTNTKSVGIDRGDKASYEDVRYGFGTPKGHILVFESHRNIPVMLGNTWPTSVDLIVD